MDQFTNGEKIDDDSDHAQPIETKEEKKVNENEKVRSSTDLKIEDNNLTPLQEYPDIVGDKALKNAANPSKTPIPQLSATNSMDDLRDIQRLRANLSKASLNFGSRSNISSICHIEEISEGRASIDRHEFKLQKKRNSQTERAERSS